MAIYFLDIPDNEHICIYLRTVTCLYKWMSFFISVYMTSWKKGEMKRKDSDSAEWVSCVSILYTYAPKGGLWIQKMRLSKYH